jgi:hypothetical protein
VRDHPLFDWHLSGPKIGSRAIARGAGSYSASIQRSRIELAMRCTVSAGTSPTAVIW